MIKEICYIGHASHCGGADTEILHTMYLWQEMGIKIYNCHTGVVHPHLKAMNLEKEVGLTYIPSASWKDLKGFHCVSFCNGQFLTHLPEIKKYCKTASFANCMTWNFQMEIQRQREGLIDFHLYQTDHQFQMVGRALKNLGKPFRPLKMKPYFRPNLFTFYYDRPIDKFRIGRISRSDPQKFNPKQLEIYEKIESPVPKDIIILGWSKEKVLKKYPDLVAQKLEKSPQPYIRSLIESSITQEEFYKHTDVLCMNADTFENLPRVGFEAMASGSILVVDKRGGWILQVEDGKTGFLCSSPEEFIGKTSFLAKNKNFKEQMRFNAMSKLIKQWGKEESMKNWDLIFKHMENLVK